MIIKKYFYFFKKRLCIYFCFLLVFLLYSYNSSMQNGNAFDFILSTICGGNIYIEQNIINLIISIFPYILLLYLFSDSFLENYSTCYAYVITRHVKKEYWFLKYSATLFINISLIFIITELEGIVIAVFFNLKYPIFNLDYFKLFFTTWLLMTLSIYIFSLIQNLISLKSGRAISFVIVTFIYIISLLIGLIVNSSNTFIKLLIPLNQLYIAHTDRITSGFEILSNKNAIPNFTMLFSIFLLIFYILIINILYLIILKHSDFLDVVRED